MNSVISRAITSEIFAERSTVQDVISSSIFASLPNDDAEENEISNFVCSRFTGQVIKNSNSIQFSDILAYNVSHLPNTVFLSRMSVAYDKMSTLPPSLIYWNAWVNHSDFIGSNVRFFKKTGETDPSGTTIAFSRFVGGGSSGTDVGIIDTVATYSDIFASDDGKNKNSWCDGKTLETVSIAYSAIKMAHSSITSAYIGGSVRRSNISFFDMGLSDTFITMSDGNGRDVPHVFSFGVMKLSHSVIAQSDCSYVFAMGTQQFLTSAQLYYSTLFGNNISLTSSNYIKNTHIYGSLQLTSNLENHIILAGLSETTIGESSSASSYIYEFGSYITSNYHKYPMIWSMGGIGLFMNKMVLGDNGVATADKKAPSIGDVLSVVGVEGNMATVAWKSGGAAGGGASSKVVVSDYDITNIPLLFDNGVADKYAKSLKSGGTNPDTDWDWAKTLVLRNGSGFITVDDDCPDYQGTVSWYFPDPNAAFKFKGATELELYHFGAIFAPKSTAIGWGDTMSDDNCKWWATKSTSMYLDFNALVEGVVYTVRVHTMILPFDNMSPEHGTPSHKLFEQDRTGEHSRTAIFFCDGGSFSKPLYWGSDGKGTAGTNTSCVYLNEVKQTTTYTSDSSSTGGYALEETTRAEVMFVKLNGSVYVMKY